VQLAPNRGIEIARPQLVKAGDGHASWVKISINWAAPEAVAALICREELALLLVAWNEVYRNGCRAKRGKRCQTSDVK
jgi:hypothetical protein